MKNYLIVHEVSVPYIGRIIDFICNALSNCENEFIYKVVSDTVDDADIVGPATVFIIGENLKSFSRRSGCIYAFLNFSVVTFIGNPFGVSFEGARLIRRKRKLLEEKLPGIDVLLDYYPAQTRVLQRELSLPVLGFLPCSLKRSGKMKPMADREFDVCFVGGISPRRRKVIDAIERMGLTLSPATGSDLEDIAARSRCTLNIHMQASNHLELPRIAGSLSTGTPVVTEKSYGIDEIFETDSIVSARAGRLPFAIAAMLQDRDRLPVLAQEADDAFAKYHEHATALLMDAASMVASGRI